MRNIYKALFSDEDSKLNTGYNFFMMGAIVLSVIPLAFKQDYFVFRVVDKVTVSIFIVDYVLRWITAGEKYKKGVLSYLKYPFTPMAIIDLVTILPSFTFVASGFKLLRLFRLVRTFKVFRAFKIFRYSKNVTMILNALKKQKSALSAVFAMALGYVVISALVVFNVEPGTFKNFFEAFYWAVISLTSVGYGDIYPVTQAGRIVTILSSFVGVAIVALPASIITAGYMEELNSDKKAEVN